MRVGPSTCSISRSKVAGSLQSPNGMILNCHSPWPVEKAVFSLELSSSWTCQYPLLRSRVENHSTPDNASILSSILGRGYKPCEWSHWVCGSPHRTCLCHLLYKYYWRWPWTWRWFNDTLFLHFLYAFLCILSLGPGESSRRLSDRFWKASINVMLDKIGTPQIVWSSREHIRKLGQELTYIHTLSLSLLAEEITPEAVGCSCWIVSSSRWVPLTNFVLALPASKLVVFQL